tara:strand:- start:270 stop:467 length:198 start_codon:yes stop_codon:yes gene_type:complete
MAEKISPKVPPYNRTFRRHREGDRKSHNPSNPLLDSLNQILDAEIQIVVVAIHRILLTNQSLQIV